MSVREGQAVERDDAFLTAIVETLAKAGVIAPDSTADAAEYADMAGMAVNVQLLDGRWATIMVEVD